MMMTMTHLGVLAAKDELSVRVEAALAGHGEGGRVSRLLHWTAQRRPGGIADRGLLSFK